MSTMFLEHIDDALYNGAVESAFNRIEKFNEHNLPKVLQLPGIATTILQHKSVVLENYSSPPDNADIVCATNDYARRRNQRTSTTTTSRSRATNQQSNNTSF